MGGGLGEVQKPIKLFLLDQETYANADTTHIKNKYTRKVSYTGDMYKNVLIYISNIKKPFLFYS